MSTNASTPEKRLRRIIDRLDDRLEQQTFLPGADHPAVVAHVSRYQDRAGATERLLSATLGAEQAALCAVRLRRLLSMHRDALSLTGDIR